MKSWFGTLLAFYFLAILIKGTPSLAFGQDLAIDFDKVRDRYEANMKAAKKDSAAFRVAGSRRDQMLKKLVKQNFHKVESIKKVDDLVALGLACETIGDLAKADTVSSRILRLSPDNCDAFRLKVNCSANKDSVVDAIQVLKNAIRLAPQCKQLPVFWGVLGIRAGVEGNPKTAIECYRKYVAGRFDRARENQSIDNLMPLRSVFPKIRNQFIATNDRSGFRRLVDDSLAALSSQESLIAGCDNDRMSLQSYDQRIKAKLLRVFFYSLTSRDLDLGYREFDDVLHIVLDNFDLYVRHPPTASLLQSALKDLKLCSLHISKANELQAIEKIEGVMASPVLHVESEDKKKFKAQLHQMLNNFHPSIEVVRALKRSIGAPVNTVLKMEKDFMKHHQLRIGRFSGVIFAAGDEVKLHNHVCEQLSSWAENHDVDTICLLNKSFDNENLWNAINQQRGLKVVSGIPDGGFSKFPKKHFTALVCIDGVVTDFMVGSSDLDFRIRRDYLWEVELINQAACCQGKLRSGGEAVNAN